MAIPPLTLSAGPSMATATAQGGRIDAPLTVGGKHGISPIILAVVVLGYYYLRGRK